MTVTILATVSAKAIATHTATPKATDKAIILLSATDTALYVVLKIEY